MAPTRPAPERVPAPVAVSVQSKSGSGIRQQLVRAELGAGSQQADRISSRWLGNHPLPPSPYTARPSLRPQPVCLTAGPNLNKGITLHEPHRHDQLCRRGVDRPCCEGLTTLSVAERLRAQRCNELLIIRADVKRSGQT